MSEQAIKILIVDDDEKTRDKLIDQLRFEDVSVVGESSFGAAAYTWAEQLDVDLVIVSIEEPVARSLRTVESLAIGTRSWPVIGISSLGDRETMRKAVVSGVRDYLVWPATPEELHQTILNVYRVEHSRRSAVEQGQVAGRIGTIVSIVGVKGGIGKSTVAANVALSLAELTKQQIALVDLDLQFGDAAVMLDVVPAKTIEHAVKDVSRSDPQAIQGFLTEHAARVKLLPAPSTPEAAEAISDDQVAQVLEMLAATHDYVIADTSAQLDGVSIRAMDLATLVLVVVVPEVPCVRRTKAALALMQEWGYSRDKVKLIVNRAHKKAEVSLAEIEEVLQYPVYAQIPEDRAAVKGISVGTPVVISAPKSDAGAAFLDLGRDLVGLPKPSRRRGLLRRKEAAAPRVGERRPPLARPGQAAAAAPTPVPGPAAPGEGEASAGEPDEDVREQQRARASGGGDVYSLSPGEPGEGGKTHQGGARLIQLPLAGRRRGKSAN